jgi:hypothetical protein
MTTAETNEYRTLERESSNHLLEHDSRLALGRYEEAARHLLEAGLQRTRMGRIQYDARKFAEAAEDWLSAADCFLRVNDAKRAQEVVGDLAGMREQRKLPGNRVDLFEALEDREERLQKLMMVGTASGNGRARAGSVTREASGAPEPAKLT